MDKIWNTIGECLSYIFDKIASINWWPFVIVTLIAVFVIPSVLLNLKIKQATKRFASGIFDEETIRLCEELKSRFILPQSAEAHDTFCIRLSAIYMKQDDFSHFFKNINAIKKVTENISNRLYMLLTAYLIEEDYLTIAELFQTQKPEELSASDYAVQILQAKNQEDIRARAALAKEKISKPDILELLSVLSA